MENIELLSVSIVTYNNSYSQVKKAIDSIINNKHLKTLYIVDNSPNLLLKDLELISKVIYIKTKNNIGFGAAHNIALKKTIEDGIKYHLVLNPDVFFDQSAIDILTDYMENNPIIGNIMPQILYPDQSTQFLCKLLPTPYDWIGRRFNPIKKMVEKRNELFELRFTNYEQIMEVPYLSGCFMYLRTESLKHVGLFDENIFMYGEETDLCRRLIVAGYKNLFYPFVSIIHEFQKGSHKSFRLTLIGIQSAIYYFNKWGWFIDPERKRINRLALNQLKIKK